MVIGTWASSEIYKCGRVFHKKQCVQFRTLDSGNLEVEALGLEIVCVHVVCSI
jgi:hypothetical protein